MGRRGETGERGLLTGVVGEEEGKLIKTVGSGRSTRIGDVDRDRRLEGLFLRVLQKRRATFLFLSSRDSCVIKVPRAFLIGLTAAEHFVFVAQSISNLSF